MKAIENKNEVFTETRTDESGNIQTVTKKIRRFSLLWGFINFEIERIYQDND